VGDLAEARAAVADAFRSDWGSVVAYLIRVTGNWDLAEESAQGAFERALERWPPDPDESRGVAEDDRTQSRP
jgi:RNA polymerase sigma-70 factor (ECF subfamily)